MSSEDPTQPQPSFDSAEGKPNHPTTQPSFGFAQDKPNHPSTQPSFGFAQDKPNNPSTPPPKLPVLPKVNLNTDTPLPVRVPEKDPHSTKASRKAVNSEQLSVTGAQPATSNLRPAARRKSKFARYAIRYTQYALLILFALGATSIALASTYAIYEYYRIASTLPDIADINSKAAQFESTYIYDSSGAQLYEINDPQKGKRTRVPLDKISPYLLAATIATEDKDYYTNPGFDVLAIAKAVYRAYRYGGDIGGASTITQQLTRALYFRLSDCDKPDAKTICYERTLDRKLREIILSAEISRRYTKDQVLELYLNEIYYGNLAYGVEAAAQTYFKKDAASLTLGEATFLAGLPQAPAVYNIYTNRDATLERQKQVLLLMIEVSGECAATGRGGILVSNSPQPMCITPEKAAQAMLEIRARTFVPPIINAKRPHWVEYIRLLLESQFGQEIYRAGFRVHTTLNPALQDFVEIEVKKQVEALAAQQVSDGAVIVIDPQTGYILAMMGSNDYTDPKDGQINMAIRPRQPGSSIKPLTYVAAFQKGWTPATVIWDVPTKFPDGANPPYEPKNYDGRFHGPVRMRDALANSYNIPAVKALEFVGVYDDPKTPQREGLIAFAETLGINSLTRKDYGLALTLGGGEVTLLEMTNAYATFANSGKRVMPIAINKITNAAGTIICAQPTKKDQVIPSADGKPLPTCQPLPGNFGEQVVRPEHAFLISDVLSDNDARSLAFGVNSILKLTFPAAVKTGTTNDVRDNWKIGYTPNLAVGVWVGNADYTPLGQNLSGVSGAAPIWKNIMEGAWKILNAKPAEFKQPDSVLRSEICDVTGAAVNEYCRAMIDPRRPSQPAVRIEFFASDQPPPKADQDIVGKAFIDKFSGLRVNQFCKDNWEEKFVINLTDKSALGYLEKDSQGQKWAEILKIGFPIQNLSPDSCGEKSPRAKVSIASPRDNETLNGNIQIVGVADVENAQFDRFVVEFGLSHDPQGWGNISGPNPIPFKNPATLATWDTSKVQNGAATIRILVFDKQGRSAEARVKVTLQQPTAVPSSTPPPTNTQPPTNTPLPTNTNAPTATSSATLMPTATRTNAPTATNTPVTPTSTFTATPAPTATFTATSAPTATFTSTATTAPATATATSGSTATSAATALPTASPTKTGTP